MNVRNYIFSLDFLNEIREAYRDSGRKIRVRYRGYRRPGKSDTQKEHAYGFVVYDQARSPWEKGFDSFSSRREYGLIDES